MLGMSSGGLTTWPPNSPTFFAALSQSSTAKYVSQCVRSPGRKQYRNQH
jgi:hypothetical protein